MAVERSQEHILGRALAVVPIPVSAIAHPSSRPTPTDGFALTVVLIDAATGLPYVASGGGGGGSVEATATADSPSYSEGDPSPLSQDLHGAQRVLIMDEVGDPLDYTIPALIEGGKLADDALGAQRPVTIGGRGANATPTAMSANGDVVNAMFDLFGRQITREALRQNVGRQVVTITSSTTETTIVTAVASTFNDIYRILINNTSATATTVTIRDGTAGSTAWVFVVGAGETKGFSGNISGATKQAAVNTNWTAQCGTSVASIVITTEYVANI